VNNSFFLLPLLYFAFQYLREPANYDRSGDMVLNIESELIKFYIRSIDSHHSDCDNECFYFFSICPTSGDIATQISEFLNVITF